jgi:acetyl esterase
MRRLAIFLLATLGVLALVGVVALQVSPWPWAIVIRFLFERGGDIAAANLAPHVPPGIVSRLDLAYDEADPDARLDVYVPGEVEGTGRVLPTIVWVHGGAWVSGSKGAVASYLQILAGRGYAVVGVEYSLAPRATHPTPVRQVNAALAYLSRHGRELHVDPSQLVLAGDSAGAQIAAQVATLVGDPSYAALLGIRPGIERDQLKGAILYCGPFDLANVDFDNALDGFARAVLWGYAGTKEFATDPAFAPFSVTRYVSAAFPPTFISAGNTDPLAPQSHEMAARLTELGVPVDALFFDEGHQPALSHEYQWDLSLADALTALDRSVAFLEGIVGER